MRSAPTLLNLLIVFSSATWLTAAPVQSASERESEPARISFSSPQEVLAACQRAAESKDVAAVRQCLLPESCHDLIFWAWFWQNRDGRAIDPFVDPERRRRLTRERLPVDEEEFQPLLLECLADYPAALAAALPQLKLDGHLEQLVIKESTATARLVAKSDEPPKGDDPPGQGIAFRKDDHGWRIDYFGYPVSYVETPDRRSSLDKKIAALEPRQPQPWTGKLAARYSSPQEVFDAYFDALSNNDPETAWNCVTPNSRKDVLDSCWLWVVDSGGGESFHHWYIDRSKRKEVETAWRKRFPPPEPSSDSDKKLTDENLPQLRRSYERESSRLELIEQCAYDPFAMFAAIIKRIDLANRRTKLKYPNEPEPRLEHLVIDGTRARGVRKQTYATNFIEFTETSETEESLGDSTVEEPYYFVFVEGSWRVDQPTFDELIAAARRENQEDRQE